MYINIYVPGACIFLFKMCKGVNKKKLKTLIIAKPEILILRFEFGTP